MKIILIVLVLLVVGYVAYSAIAYSRTLAVSQKLIQGTVPYEKISSDTSKSILILGDSTAVGIGATSPSDSIAGRTATAVNATYVENRGVSGAVVTDLPSQIAAAKLDSYSLIVVQIGGNDVVRFRSAKKTAQTLTTILKTLPTSEKVIVLSAGDVGSAPAIPAVLRPFYTRLTLQYHANFNTELTKAGYTYINLYATPNNHLFSDNPDKYFAVDKFHPSSDGYGLWFESVAAVLPH